MSGPEGWRTTLRYLRHTPKFWSSDVAEAVVDELDLQPGEVMLDVGAGMGSMTLPAAAKVGSSGRVIVAEPNPAMIRVLQARRLMLRGDRPIVELHQNGLDHLPAADGSIDAAASLNVLHHVPDHKQAAAELARVMKPGGRVLLVDEDFTDPTHPSSDGSGHSHSHDHGDDHDHDHHHGFEMIDVAGTASLLIEAGFAEAQGEKRSVGGVPARVVSAIR